jgi:6-phosphogluconolactonase (cycloisomerase 2 family)
MNRGLNGTGIGSGIAGFRNMKGVLAPIPSSSRTLGLTGGPVLGQVGLGLDGGVIVVTDRNNSVYSWPVKKDGTPGPLTTTPSPGAVPFGFAFTRRDVMIVSEAGGTATSGGSTVSSYGFNPKTIAPVVVSAAVPTTQGAACWIAVTPDGRYAFSANAASSTVSSFSVARGGALTLLNAQAALMAGAGALDMAVSPDGGQLHVFGSRAPQSIFTYAIDDGALTLLGTSVGPVSGAAGLAAN